MNKVANVLLYVSLFIIWAMLFYYAFLMYGGYIHHTKYMKFGRRLIVPKSEYPSVSILIPAHNEELVIQATLQAVVQLNYPKEKLEVIVINDNSSDHTGAIVDQFSKTYPFVQCIHVDPLNGGNGKSGALNNGLLHAAGEIIAVYDADNTPERDALKNLALGLVKDKKAGAIVGKFRVINSNKNLLTRLINIETITFQWLAQAGRWFWFRMTTIPGTNFAIRRSILDELGGWDEKALSEDTELSIRVYNLGYYIRFFPQAITWEQEPEKLSVWWRQRTRWAKGNLYVIFKYLFSFRALKYKKIFIDLLYFLFTYILFLSGILLSHIIFITNLFIDLQLTIGPVSYVLLIAGFLLFVTEVCLALSMERGQLTKKNVLTVLFMYFTYSQMWIFLVIYSSILELKRVVLREETTWYKTKRFAQKKKTRQHIA